MPQQSSVPVSHLTAPELAVRLNLTPDHLRRTILGQPNGIPGMKMGDGPKAQWRIKLCDIEQWEASRIVCYDAAPRPRKR